MKNESVFSCLKSVISNNRSLSFALCLTAVLSVLASLAPPQIMKIIIDRFLSEKQAADLISPCVLYLAVIILIGGLDFLKSWLLTFFGQRSIRVIRAKMLKKLGLLPSVFFTQNSAGSISSRITTDVQNVNVLFSDGLVSMAVDSLKVVGIIVSIWIFSYRLALVALCLIPVLYMITHFFRVRMLDAQTKNLTQLGRVNGHIAESVRNILMIKLFSKECWMEDKYCRELEANYKTKGQVIIYDSCYAPIIQLIRAIVISVVVILSAEQIGIMGISIGMIAATIDLISSLLVPVESLGMEIQNIQQGLSGIKRIDAFLALDEDEKDESITAEAVIKGCGNCPVAFENLSFSYEKDMPVLKGLTIRIPFGEIVTIAGRTGVGKSTLFGLMMGLLQPTEGSVLVGGFEAHRIPDGIKRRIFGYVEQSFRFVPGTIADQVSLGEPSITRERIIEVCESVGLSESIKELPKGYDTVLTGNSTFSWGQCQLLSIARAVAADPKILLLDEITANLDSTTEERIMSALCNVSAGRTVITISHRESAMRGCNRLVYIENGEISAHGTPEKLLGLVN